MEIISKKIKFTQRIHFIVSSMQRLKDDCTMSGVSIPEIEQELESSVEYTEFTKMRKFFINGAVSFLIYLGLLRYSKDGIGMYTNPLISYKDLVDCFEEYVSNYYAFSNIDLPTQRHIIELDKEEEEKEKKKIIEVEVMDQDTEEATDNSTTSSTVICSPELLECHQPESPAYIPTPDSPAPPISPEFLLTPPTTTIIPSPALSPEYFPQRRKVAKRNREEKRLVDWLPVLQPGFQNPSKLFENTVMEGITKENARITLFLDIDDCFMTRFALVRDNRNFFEKKFQFIPDLEDEFVIFTPGFDFLLEFSNWPDMDKRLVFVTKRNSDGVEEFLEMADEVGLKGLNSVFSCTDMEMSKGAFIKKTMATDKIPYDYYIYLDDDKVQLAEAEKINEGNPLLKCKFYDVIQDFKVDYDEDFKYLWNDEQEKKQKKKEEENKENIY